MRSRASSTADRSQWWQSWTNGTCWVAPTWLLLLLLGLSTASAVLTCREAIRLSDLNHDELLNASPEYTTFLQRISSFSIDGSSESGNNSKVNSSTTITTTQHEFDSLSTNLQVHFHAFSRNNKEGINISDSYKIFPAGQSSGLDEFCQRTKEILRGSEGPASLSAAAPGDDGKGDHSRRGSGMIGGTIRNNGVGNGTVKQSTMQGGRGTDSENDILGYVIHNGDEEQHDASMGSLFETLMSLFDNGPNSNHLHNHHSYLRAQRRRLITVEECAEFLDFSDSDGNGSFNKAEFVLLVNLLTDHYRAASFSDLPGSVQQIFHSLDPSGDFDNQRRLPSNVFQHGIDDTATDAVASMDTICSQIRTAMDKEARTSQVIHAMPMMSSADDMNVDSLLQEPENTTEANSTQLNATELTPTNAPATLFNTSTDAMNTTQDVTAMNTTLGNQTNVTDSMNTTQNVTFLPTMNTSQNNDTFLPAMNATQELFGNQTNVTLAPSESNQTVFQNETNLNNTFPPAMNTTEETNVTLAPTMDQTIFQNDTSMNNTQPETLAPSPTPTDETTTNTTVPPALNTTAPLTLSPSTAPPLFTQPPGTLAPVTTPPIANTTTPAPTTPPNTTAPQPTPAPGPPETVTGLNSWVLSNRLQQTAMDLMSDSESFAGISRAYESFTENIVAQLSASRAMRLRSRRRNLAVSIQPGSASVYELTDSKCPPTSAETDSCVTAFGKVNLRVSGENTSSVLDEYTSVSQFEIEAGLLEVELNEQDPGSLWLVVGSSTPVDPTEASPTPPDDVATDDRGGYDLVLGLSISAAIAVFLVLLACVFVILPALRKKRELEESKKDALYKLREAELLHAAAIAKKEGFDKVDEEPNIGPPWPKTCHDEWENPFRQLVEALLRDKAPDLIDELDSLLHQYQGREEELIAILEDIRSDESLLNADSDCEVDIEELSLSIAENIPADAPTVVDEVPVAEVEEDDKSEEWESESEAESQAVAPLEPPVSGGSGSSLDPPGEDATDRAEDDRLEPEETSRSIPLEPVTEPEPTPEPDPPLEPEPAPEPDPPREPTPEPMEEPEELPREPTPEPEPEQPAPPSPPSPPLKVEEPAKKMNDSDHVTEESDWLSSSSDGSRGYRIHWTQKNGCWFAKKVPIEQDLSESSGYFSSSSEDSDEEHEARWVKNGGNWKKEYFNVDEGDSDSEYDSTSSEEDELPSTKWVSRNGQWDHHQEELNYSSDEH